MSAFRSYLAVAAIFLLGSGAGAAGMQLYRARAERQILAGPEPVISLAVAALDRDLDLDESQEAAVREALRDARREILTDDPNLLPRLEGVFERAQTRIAASLDPEQRERFAREVERRRQTFREVQGAARTPGR